MDPTQFRQAAAPALPFLGRTEELERLRPASARTPHRWLTGATGVGKTRLLREYADQLVGEGATLSWVAGREPDASSALDAALAAEPGLVIVDDADHLDDSGKAALDRALAARPGHRQIVASSLLRPDTLPVSIRLLDLAPLDTDLLSDLLAYPPWSELFAIDTIDGSVEARRAVDRLLAEEFRFGYVGGRGAEDSRRAESALAALQATASPPGEAPPDLVARLLARAAVGRLGDPDPVPARTRAEQALAVALDADLDDRRALGEALVAYAVTDLGPDSLDERLAMSRRILAIAADLDSPVLSSLGRFLLLGSLLESGDIGAIDAELALRVRDTGGGGEEAERHAAWFRAMRAILDGRVDEAESRCADALEIARAEGDPDAESVYFGQLGIVRWLQGREGEVEAFYLAAREEQPHAPVWQAVLARLWALGGRRQLAQDVLDEFSDPSVIPRDRNWLLTVCVLAEAAAVLEDTRAAATLRSELLPYAGRLVPIGAGIACFGSVARPLALIARTLGRVEEAERHLKVAIRVCSTAGARPWLAQAQLDLADLLSADGRGDEQLAADAAATARATGVPALLSRLPSQDAVSPPTSIASLPPARPTVRVLGAFEVVGADGRRASWTSRKARELLKILVARRGRPVPRDELIGMLWPDDRLDEASNRLSVALSTVRRALDPMRDYSPGHLVVGQGDAIALAVEHVDVDLLDFLTLARAVESADATQRRDLGRRALEAYRGPAFADEPDSAWAEGIRMEAAALFLAVARTVGTDALADDPLVAAEAYRRILAEDPYDEGGHLGLVAAYDALGAHGRSEEARRKYYAHMAEIGIPVERLRRPATSDLARGA